MKIRLRPFFGQASVLLLTFLAASTCVHAQQFMEQPGSPLPGTGQAPSVAPDFSTRTNSAPVPGNQPVRSSGNYSSYRTLPLTQQEAQTRLDELGRLIITSRPQDIQDSIYHLCEWLADVADAHSKLAISFAKHESTKRASDLEKQASQRFSQLKNQAQLLKAELLIKQQRYPEALAPLIEIVVAEPRSKTGQKAYKRLQDLGFSEQIDETTDKADSSSLPLGKPQNAVTRSPVTRQSVPRKVVTQAKVVAQKPLAQIKNKIASRLVLPEKKPAQVTGKQSRLWMSGSPAGDLRQAQR